MSDVKQQYKEADPSQIEVTFIPNSNPSFASKSVGYGRITSNGISFFYNAYLTDKSPLGVYLGLPSKQKADGTWENTVIINSAENRAIFTDLVVQEMTKKGVSVKSGAPVPVSVKKAIAPAVTAKEEEYDFDESELPF